MMMMLKGKQNIEQQEGEISVRIFVVIAIFISLLLKKQTCKKRSYTLCMQYTDDDNDSETLALSLSLFSREGREGQQQILMVMAHCERRRRGDDKKVALREGGKRPHLASFANACTYSCYYTTLFSAPTHNITICTVRTIHSSSQISCRSLVLKKKAYYLLLLLSLLLCCHNLPASCILHKRWMVNYRK